MQESSALQQRKHTSPAPCDCDRRCASASGRDTVLRSRCPTARLRASRMSIESVHLRAFSTAWPVPGFALRNRRGVARAPDRPSAPASSSSICPTRSDTRPISCSASTLSTGTLTSDAYMGATCGRYGSRIRAGRFPLEGTLVRAEPQRRAQPRARRPPRASTAGSGARAPMPQRTRSCSACIRRTATRAIRARWKRASAIG